MSDRIATPADMEFIFSLYERHKGVMYKTALDMDVRDEDRRNDAVHEALLRLPDKIDTLRSLGDKGRAAYMASVVRNVIRAWNRRGRVERVRLVDADVSELTELSDDGFETELIEREARRQRLVFMWEALGELSESDRALLIAKYVDGKSDAEIARRLGKSPSSIPQKLTRAKRRARRLILRKEGEA